MSDPSERAVHIMIVPELFGLFVVWCMLVASLVGYTSLFTSYSRLLRLGSVAFLTLELAIPVGVYLDLRRRTDDPDSMWIHAAALPVVNILGAIAYIEDRQRSVER